jgi:hypothetical protein
MCGTGRTAGPLFSRLPFRFFRPPFPRCHCWRRSPVSGLLIDCNDGRALLCGSEEVESDRSIQFAWISMWEPLVFLSTLMQAGRRPLSSSM